MRKEKKYAKLVELVRSAPADVICRVAGLCDGHGILKPEALVKAGLPKVLVEQMTVTHRSDLSDPKRILFVNGRPVRELRGVYGLQLLEFLADALGVEYRRCLGRGFQAAAIKQALHRHLNRYAQPSCEQEPPAA